jgi:hypothetical protein
MTQLSIPQSLLGLHPWFLVLPWTTESNTCAGFVDSLKPKGCPAKSDTMWSDRGTVSLVVVTLSVGQACLRGGDLDSDSDSGLGHEGWCC